MLTARLHGHGPRGLYSVIYDGKLLVDQSRDPECDAARALLAMGITGKLTMLDGKTGSPRTIIDIEKAAKLTVEEGPNGPRFRRFRGVESASTALEELEPMPGLPQRHRRPNHTLH